MSWTAVQIVGTVLSAKAQMDAAKQRKRQYEAQAAAARLKGRRDALAYRQKAVEKLRQTRETMASITARSAAGTMDPFSGTSLSLTNYVAGVGYDDLNVLRENAEMSINAGIIQQQQYLTAGDEAMRQGRLGAMATLAVGFGTAMKTGTPAAANTPSSTPGYYTAPAPVSGYSNTTYVPASPSSGQEAFF